MSTFHKDENNDDDDDDDEDEDNDGNDDDDITITIKYGHVAEGLGGMGRLRTIDITGGTQRDSIVNTMMMKLMTMRVTLKILMIMVIHIIMRII